MFKIVFEQKVSQQQDEEPTSPSQQEMQRAMAENLHGRDISNTRILAFQNKAPAPPEVCICYKQKNIFYGIKYNLK